MNSAKRVFAPLAVLLALCVAPAAHAKVDYSMNAAGGDYAAAVTPKGDTAAAKVDYSMNAAGGDYAAAVTPQADTAVASTGSEFAWGAAALGAGAALAVVLLVTVTRSRLSTSRSHREAA